MKLHLRCCTLALLLAVAAACAPTAAQPTNAPRTSTNRISAEEVQQSTASNAYELVQTMRPSWLRTRGTQSINNEGTIMVYFDNIRMGGPEMLRSIPVSNIASLEFLDAASATQRWGTGHSHGAILVRSVGGGRF